jgi:leader peptidase (prepilin peptidase) / N-methyltransferase
VFGDLFHLLSQTPGLHLAVWTVIGLIIGSFLNVVAYRMPRMMQRDWRRQCAELQGQPVDEDEAPFNLVRPRSRCPECDHGITWYENIPVLSWLMLRGRCSACGCRISMRYPIVEALTGLLTGVVAWHFGFGLQTAAAALVTWYLIAMSLIDLDTQYLYDELTLPLLWIGLTLSLFGVFVAPADAIAGAALGYLSLWSVFHLFRWVTGKEGMGYGDFKLLAALGAFTGPGMLVAIILISTIVGAVVGLSMIALQRLGRGVPISFGPYLAAAGWIVLLWGDPIVERYLDFLAGR